MTFKALLVTFAALTLSMNTSLAQQQDPHAAHMMAQGAPPQHGTAMAKARAQISGKGISGTLDLIEYKMGTAAWVEVTLKAKGLPPGLHGVHLHAVGKCEPDFMAAGGHFDPGPAGNTDPDANHPFHMGDLPNVDVNASGEGSFVAATTRVMISDGPLSIFDADGTAVILHGNADRGITGEPKSGVSGGPRVACGILQKM